MKTAFPFTSTYFVSYLQVSFTFWWKQLADGSNTREGIFGNSLLSEANAANIASVRLITDTVEGRVEGL